VFTAQWTVCPYLKQAPFCFEGSVGLENYTFDVKFVPVAGSEITEERT